MKKLIPMIDYVIGQWDRDIYTDDFAQLMIKYATFLKQPLTLGMFVPCDENGNVFEYSENDFDISYQKAKEKVIFEGCKAEKEANSYIITDSKNSVVWVSWNTSKTIEDLIPYNLTLCKTKYN